MRIRLFTIPNLLTLMNLLCGSFAVVAALMYNDLTLAFWLIVAGIVFDFFDGFVARLLHSPSAIGVQLDSLADVITSGLAPAAVLWQVCLQTEPCWLPEAWKLGYGVFVLAAFSALRLAKFNIDETQTVEFCGLPTPRRIASLRFARHAVAAGNARSLFGRGVADRRADLPAPRFSDPHVRSQVPRLRLARKRGAIPLSAGEYRVDNYTSYIRYPGNYRFIYRRVGGSLALHALGKSR